MDINRRSFLKKLSAAILLPAAGFSLFSLWRKKSDNMASETVLDVQPLGFPWVTLDPFLFCVHHEDFYPQGNQNFGPNRPLTGRDIGQDFTIKDGWRMYHGQKVPGFPGHPHRGFETVTFVRQGLIDHSDSAGASGRYGAGDVQWMTAGAGIQHSEMFPLMNMAGPNTLELFQIWLNLPRERKMVNPHFKMLWNDQVPKFSLQDKNGKTIALEIAAGSLAGKSAPTPPPDSWAADPANEVAIWHADLESGAEWILPPAGSVNRMVYFYRGASIALNEQKFEPGVAIHVKAQREIRIINGNEPAKVLVLQGRPIGEPVVQYGPFVMNSRQEIEQAFADYRRTHFGGWPWPSNEPVHGAMTGRFAKHADGRVETRPA